MLTVYDKDLNKLGKLNNAFNVSVERRANEINGASFSLPLDDDKNDLCTHFNYIDVYGESGRYYGKYRIMPTKTKKNENTESITYECEHVLATLLDDVMLDYSQLNGLPTKESLETILNQQTTQNWVVGQVDFERFFSYAFENENGLLAPVLSVPQPFDEPYLFTFDTQSYPWTLNLIRPSDDVTWDIRWGRDMISFDEVSDPSKIVNRIYPKGYGEGVNQLTIDDVNNGTSYVEDATSIQEWGLHPYIWIDKRFEDAQTLKSNAESLLSQWKDPKISFDIKSADLSIKEEFKHLQRPFYTVGNIVVDDTTYQARIIGEKIPDLSKEYDVQYKIDNKLDDVADLQTDIERRQQVNDAYSQGATNILNFSYQDNCDSLVPALIPFYIDDDVRNVNTCELTFRTKAFRSYSQATEGGGSIAETTSSGGGQTTSSGGGTVTSTSSGGGQTTSSGGSVNTSTASGGGTTTSTPSGGNHRHRLFVRNSAADGTTFTNRAFFGWIQSQSVSSTINIPFANGATVGDIYTFDADGDHTHDVNIPSHTHDFSVPSHTHTVSNHTHDVTIASHTHTVDDHTHSITLPDHTHDIKHGIYELNNTVNSVEIKVDGNIVNFTNTEGDRIDLTDYMTKDSEGKVTRGRHEVTISPDALARIEADVILRVFIQSRLGTVL